MFIGNSSEFISKVIICILPILGAFMCIVSAILIEKRRGHGDLENFLIIIYSSILAGLFLCGALIDLYFIP